MQSVEIYGLDELDRALAQAIKDAPAKRRELHTQLSQLIKSEVDKDISGSINDSHGKIQGWQERVVGSGGGYAAVRPVSTSTGANSPGAITNYLTSGHAIRRPSGTAKRQRRSRARMAYVDGRHFYETAARNIEAPALQLAQDFVNDLGKQLEG